MERKKDLLNLIVAKYLVAILMIVLIVPIITGCDLFINDARYEFDKETGTIIEYLGSQSNIIIPAEIEGVPVTSIGDHAFLGNNVMSIDGTSSRNFILTSVTIPSSVTSIGEHAFWGNDLKSVTIKGDKNRFNESWNNYGFPKELRPDIIKYDGMYFDPTNGEIIKYKGKKLNIIIPEEIAGVLVTSVGYYAFYDKNLKSVVIPNSVTNISTRAFSMNKLTNVSIPSSVINIDDAAFMQNSLTTVTIPNSVTSIGVSAFRTNNLTSITIPESVISMGNYAFQNNDLTNITIEGEEYRFNNSWMNYNFPLELMPGIVTYNEMYFDSFNGKIVRYEGNQTDVVIPTEIEGIAVTKIGNHAFASHNIATITIPKGIISIEDYAFHFNQLTNITLPSSLTSIGKGAFKHNKLTSITIPSGVTNISDYLFEENNLITIIIPEGVTNIGKYAFSCNDLTSITIAESVTSIGDSAFQSNNLTSVIVEGDAFRFNETWTKYNIPIELMPGVINYNEMYFDSVNGRIVYYKGSETNVVIPAEIEGIAVTSIREWVFTNKNLTSVIIPNSVISIGNYAFASNNIETITIPESVTSIGRGAFSGMFDEDSLTSVIIEGDETRFNDLWEYIGFPDNLKP